jgi:hypothetical protein
MSGIIQLPLGEANQIRTRWIEIAKIENPDEYYREAGKLLEETMQMYKQKLAEPNVQQQVRLTEDTLTPTQLEELEKVREEIVQKIERKQIFERFITVLSRISPQLSSISDQRSKLGGRKYNKRSRSRRSSQNKRYSRRRGNVGKSRQYSSRRK